MKLIVSLTSIPTRFSYLLEITNKLLAQECDEIWVNIPPAYKRFPEWNGSFPPLDPRIIINRMCEDLGPATKYFGSAIHQDPETLIVYVDDDTSYDRDMCLNLKQCITVLDSTAAWGLSGFTCEDYFKKQYPRTHGVELDVLEGYGGVIVKAGWMCALIPDFKDIIETVDKSICADDLITSCLLHKFGIKRKTIYTRECHIGKLNQLSFGFGVDALHAQFDGGHNGNYYRVLKSLQDKNINYFKYRCL